MLNFKKNNLKYFLSISLIVLTAVSIFGVIEAQDSENNTSEENSADIEIISKDITKLTSEIDAKKAEIEAMEAENEKLEQALENKRGEVNDLKSQISVVEDSIRRTELEIQRIEAEKEKTNLEISLTLEQIKVLENREEREQLLLSEILRNMQQKQNRSYLVIFLSNQNLSDAISEINSLRSYRYRVLNILKSLEDTKLVMTDKAKDLNIYKDELEKQDQELSLKVEQKQGEITAKAQILELTKEEEGKFSELVELGRQEIASVNSAVTGLQDEFEAKLKEKRRLELGDDEEIVLGDATLMWPVPSKIITADFHDPDYPYRYIFEHPAIDIRAAQRTPVKAAADGIVVKAVNNGMGYSYIILLHNGELMTVYGHMTEIYVSAEQMIKQGEVIGLSGGMPGTPGAGRLTTGPHLHFEVRLNGIPVDPKGYLP